jgi:NAD(P)H-hydrate epimerase
MSQKWNKNLFMTRSQMRKYDSIAINDLKMAGAVLMENAGRMAANAAKEMLGPKGAAVVIAGAGNNGGDGFVVARYLLNYGCNVTLCLSCKEPQIKGDALYNFNILKTMKPRIIDISSSNTLGSLENTLKNRDLIVDALLGTGVNKPVTGHFADIIEMINSSSVPVLAIDIPSGLDADTGRPYGTCIKATRTVTFGHYKRGMLLYPGASLCGTTEVVSIGVPGEVSKLAGVDGAVTNRELALSLMPASEITAHKGTMGHLLVLAGSAGKSGAAVMASQSAMKVGTGLVTIATSANAQPIIESKCLEVMVEPIIEKTDAPITEKTISRLKNLLHGKKAVAIGPGLGTSPGISNLVMRLLQMIDIPAVVDADGINIMAKDPTGSGKITAPLVLTPHPGEMARLVDKSIEEVQANRIELTAWAAKWHNRVIVLKGAHSVIADPDGSLFINPTGNPGMATGGTGDVLTGIIGGYLARGLKPFHAAILGTYIHGLSGDEAAKTNGYAALVASDIINILPQVQKQFGR